jgi:hypothetical protein
MVMGGILFSTTVYFSGCTSNDEPGAPDCATSDLALALDSKVDVTSCAAANGSIVAVATGGATPYQYSVNGGAFQSSNTFTNLAAGSYTVRVKDKNNCEKQISPNVVLTSPDGPDIAASGLVADTECGSDNGSITVNATGGTGTLTYSKDGTTFQAGNVFNNLRAGDYTITVKDAGNCTTTVSETVANGTGIDYVNDIKPIFVANCQIDGCHPANGDWFNYNVAKSKASTIKERTGNKSMPKTGSLTDQEIAAIACWADHGAPQN